MINTLSLGRRLYQSLFSFARAGLMTVGWIFGSRSHNFISMAPFGDATCVEILQRRTNHSDANKNAVHLRFASRRRSRPTCDGEIRQVVSGTSCERRLVSPSGFFLHRCFAFVQTDGAITVQSIVFAQTFLAWITKSCECFIATISKFRNKLLFLEMGVLDQIDQSLHIDVETCGSPHGGFQLNPIVFPTTPGVQGHGVLQSRVCRCLKSDSALLPLKDKASSLCATA